LRRLLALHAAATSLLLLGAGCHRRPSGPSPHYDRGAAIYQELYVRELDDAFLDPKMDEAVAELKQVPADSISAHLASDLLGQIEKGRKEAAAARDTRAKEFAAAQQPVTLDPSKVLAADARQAALEVDAGAPLAPVVDPYGPGAPIADINRDTGGCLVAGTPFREEGSGKEGQSYKLAEDPVCRSKLPGFVNQTVLALDGRIYRRVSSSEVKTEKAPPADAGAPGANKPDATSLNSNVTGQQNATPGPTAPSVPFAPRASPAVGVSNVTNVAAEQNATPPPSPPSTVPAAQVEDATPPPAQ